MPERQEGGSMDEMLLSELKPDMLEWVRRRCEQDGNLSWALNPETDLIEDALLDSISFIELLAFVESRTGISIEIEQIAQEDLTSVAGICRHVDKLMGTKP
jgi:acyl carrier protein